MKAEADNLKNKILKVMTTDQIRKNIIVENWWLNSNGIMITYKWISETKPFFESRRINMNPNQAHNELIELGEADPDNSDWDWVMKNYDFSQWDAINWVTKHEFNKAAALETKAIDIGKSIEDMF